MVDDKTHTDSPTMSLDYLRRSDKGSPQDLGRSVFIGPLRKDVGTDKLAQKIFQMLNCVGVRSPDIAKISVSVKLGYAKVTLMPGYPRKKSFLETVFSDMGDVMSVFDLLKVTDKPHKLRVLNGGMTRITPSARTLNTHSPGGGTDIVARETRRKPKPPAPPPSEAVRQTRHTVYETRQVLRLPYCCILKHMLTAQTLCADCKSQFGDDEKLKAVQNQIFETKVVGSTQMPWTKRTSSVKKDSACGPTPPLDSPPSSAGSSGPPTPAASPTEQIPLRLPGNHGKESHHDLSQKVQREAGLHTCAAANDKQPTTASSDKQAKAGGAAAGDKVKKASGAKGKPPGSSNKSGAEKSESPVKGNTVKPLVDTGHKAQTTAEVHSKPPEETRVQPRAQSSSTISLSHGANKHLRGSARALRKKSSVERGEAYTNTDLRRQHAAHTQDAVYDGDPDTSSSDSLLSASYLHQEFTRLEEEDSSSADVVHTPNVSVSRLLAGKHNNTSANNNRSNNGKHDHHKHDKHHKHKRHTAENSERDSISMSSDKVEPPPLNPLIEESEAVVLPLVRRRSNQIDGGTSPCDPSLSFCLDRTFYVAGEVITKHDLLLSVQGAVIHPVPRRLNGLLFDEKFCRRKFGMYMCALLNSGGGCIYMGVTVRDKPTDSRDTRDPAVDLQEVTDMLEHNAPEPKSEPSTHNLQQTHSQIERTESGVKWEASVIESLHGEARRHRPTLAGPTEQLVVEGFTHEGMDVDSPPLSEDRLRVRIDDAVMSVSPHVDVREYTLNITPIMSENGQLEHTKKFLELTVSGQAAHRGEYVFTKERFIMRDNELTVDKQCPYTEPQTHVTVPIQHIVCFLNNPKREEPQEKSSTHLREAVSEGEAL